ncbi:hypothetical protein ACUWFQ_002101 [Campylobacter jejuni]|uniref:Uncharacterized protein n=1 Tax=Campylobacter jejuni TaxID=197 RepID=A0A5C4YFY4_CAMJU|nr:hypothetical protein [Campylobacter jejuni]EAH8791852.1 hypothetical protein [Campylobacter jejuni]EJK3624439.1 hypothetical protein [Campylobacter jejuni]TNO42004.1 hypothetical protein FH034_04590 [Campylobacter jejuni]
MKNKLKTYDFFFQAKTRKIIAKKGLEYDLEYWTDIKDKFNTTESFEEIQKIQDKLNILDKELKNIEIELQKQEKEKDSVYKNLILQQYQNLQKEHSLKKKEVFHKKSLIPQNNEEYHNELGLNRRKAYIKAMDEFSKMDEDLIVLKYKLELLGFDFEKRVFKE